jgi:hypothetical protein
MVEPFLTVVVMSGEAALPVKGVAVMSEFSQGLRNSTKILRYPFYK